MQNARIFASFSKNAFAEILMFLKLSHFTLQAFASFQALASGLLQGFASVKIMVLARI